MGDGLLNKATDALANTLGVTQSNIDVIEDVPGTSSGPQPGHARSSGQNPCGLRSGGAIH